MTLYRVLSQAFVKEVGKAFHGGLEKLYKSGESLCPGSRSSEGTFTVKRGTKAKMRRRKSRGINQGSSRRTLRAEEMGTQMSCINVDHITQERWGPALVDADDLQRYWRGRLGGTVRALQRNQ